MCSFLSPKNENTVKGRKKDLNICRRNEIFACKSRKRRGTVTPPPSSPPLGWKPWEQEEPWELLKQYLKTFYPRSRVSNLQKVQNTGALWGCRSCDWNVSVTDTCVSYSHRSGDPWTPAPQTPQVPGLGWWNDDLLMRVSGTELLHWNLPPPVRGLYLSDTVSFYHCIFQSGGQWTFNL